MLVDRSQSRLIPLKIVKHPMQVLPRGHISSTTQTALTWPPASDKPFKVPIPSTDVIITPTKYKKKSTSSESQTSSSQTYSLQPSTSSKTPTKTSSKPSTASPSRSSLPKPSDSNSKQTTKNKNKNQQNSNRLRKAEKDIFKLTNRYDGINCDTNIWGDAMDTSLPESRSSSSLSSNGGDSCSPPCSHDNREQIHQCKRTISPIRTPK